MSILVTGAAGFIGSALSRALLARGDRVVGLDDFNAYYDPALKEARAARLTDQANFTMVRADIADKEAVLAATREHGPFRRIVHLAAQAGVRYSLENPMAYVQTNLVGQLNILELCRQTEGFEHLVYASSSSVYGGNTKLPFALDDRVDTPVSIYAATKRADELMGHSYSHLYGLPMTGLRYFTVYGPWGRPDMALFIFTKAIFEGRPIRIFNHGDMMRDFTYIDDIVDGTMRALDNPPNDGEQLPWRLYNIGNHRSEPLLRLIEVLEQAIGRRAERQLEPMQPGDVKETYADISAIQQDLGFVPTTQIDEGVPRFVDWYRDYHGL